MRNEFKGIEASLIIEKYNELNNVWKVGEYFGIAGQEIHRFLTEVGKIHKMRVLTEEEKQRLLKDYVYYRNRCELDILAKEMGRTKNYLSRQARALGLTSKDRSQFNLSDEKHKKLSQSAKDRIKKHGHPRGMSGKKHSEETKRHFSITSKERWQKNHDIWITDEVREFRSDRMKLSQSTGVLGVRSRCYMFDVTVGGKSLKVKSTWEYDIALYLQYLLDNGFISSWDYEDTTFDFAYSKNGVRSYKPDFRVLRGDREYFIEVKGWRDEKSRLKENLMKQHYPSVKMLYVRQHTYNLIDKKYRHKIEGFGKLKEQMGIEDKKCSVSGCNNRNHSKGLCRHHYYTQYKR